MFGFRPRDQHVARYTKVTAVELLHSGDLLCRLVVEALMEIAPIVNPPDLYEFVARMGVEPCAILTRGVRQQHFGGESRNCDSSLFKKLLTL